MHKDGYGIAYLEGNVWKAQRSLNAVFDDEISPPNSHTYLLHARKASVGDNGTQNVHPFQSDGYVFAHEGTINDPIIMERDAIDDIDSEKLFSYLIEGREPTIQSLTEKMAGITDYKAANFILANHKRAFIGAFQTEYPNYNALHIATDGNYTIVSSEPIPTLGLEWTQLEHGTILEIEIGSGQSIN